MVVTFIHYFFIRTFAVRRPFSLKFVKILRTLRTYLRLGGKIYVFTSFTFLNPKNMNYIMP